MLIFCPQIDQKYNIDTENVKNDYGIVCFKKKKVFTRCKYPIVNISPDTDQYVCVYVWRISLC